MVSRMYQSGNALAQAPFVLDTMVISHALQSDQLDLLLHLTTGRPCVVTDVVVDEVTQHHPVWTPPPTLSVVTTSDFMLFPHVGTWLERLGTAKGRNRGEAASMAWAQVNGGIVVTDDKKARDVALKHRQHTDGWCVHGVLYVIGVSVARGDVSGPSAYSGLCDALLRSGIRWPFEAGHFATWYAANQSSFPCANHNP